MSAVLWTSAIELPVIGAVDDYITCFKTWLSNGLVSTPVVLVFDRYYEFSPKSSARAMKASSVRMHKLELQTPLSTKDAVLTCISNKQELTSLLCHSILRHTSE